MGENTNNPFYKYVSTLRDEIGCLTQLASEDSFQSFYECMKKLLIHAQILIKEGIYISTDATGYAYKIPMFIQFLLFSFTT